LNELIVPLDRIEEQQRSHEEALATGFSTYESFRKRKDGSLAYVAVTSKTVLDRDGKVEFILSSKKDLTHLKIARDARMVEARFWRSVGIHT